MHDGSHRWRMVDDSVAFAADRRDELSTDAAADELDVVFPVVEVNGVKILNWIPKVDRSFSHSSLLK